MAKRYQKTAFSQYLVVLIGLIVLVSIGLFLHAAMTRVHFFDEFAIPWSAGRSWLLKGESPYSLSAYQNAKIAVDESIYLAKLPGNRNFLNPIYSLIFYLPFSLLPFSTARILWTILIVISVGLIGLLSLNLTGWLNSTKKIIGAVVILLLCFPSAYIILAGNLTPIIILLLLAVIYLMVKNRDTTAGLLLSLTISSANLTGLFLLSFIIWSITKRRWQAIIGFCAGTIFLALVFWLIIPSWFTEWASLMIDNFQGWTWINTPLMIFAELLPGVAKPLSYLLHAVLLILIVIMIGTGTGSTARQFIYKSFLILAMSYFVFTKVITSNLIILVPALFILFKTWSDRRGLFGEILAWTILICCSIGSWVPSFSNLSFLISYESLWITVGFPVIMLISLLWVYPWASRRINLK